jgi:diguanylate cyclase (GGDEF)-like protein
MITNEVLTAAAGGIATALPPFAFVLRRAYATIRRLQHAATHDVVTGLTNRAGLLDDLATRASRRGSYAVAVIDLDGFKAINDTHGHDVGDRVLQVVADRLAAVAAEAGGLAARLGGDEFVLVAPSPSSRLSRIHGVDAHEAIAKPMHVGGLVFDVRASVGVVHALPGDPADELLNAGDIAMYRAKVNGGGVVEYDIARTLPTVPDGRPIVRLRTSTDARRFLAEVAR